MLKDRKMVSQADPGKAARVRAMFARIVPSYDKMNTLMTWGLDRRWRRIAAQLAQPEDKLILDLATGTGELALELCRQGASAVVGVDFCYEMLTAAVEKIKLRAISDRVTLVAGDARRLPFDDQTFDCVLNGFLLRNVVDLTATLAEMYRVLKPGGRLVCLEITHPRALLSLFFWLYFHGLVPLMGALVAGDHDAYRYLSRSLEHFPDANRLAQLMRRIGLVKVSYRRLGLGTVAVHMGQKPED